MKIAPLYKICFYAEETCPNDLIFCPDIDCTKVAPILHISLAALRGA